ncbi:MAG: PAS domain S-box protein [Pyrinomonadaceae bacterium]
MLDIKHDMENSRIYLNQILNSVADPIFVNDREHRMVLVNDAFCQMEGRSREEIIGKTTMEFCEPDEAQIYMGMDNLVFESGEATSNEEQFTDLNGRQHVLMTKKTLYEDPNGDRFIVGSIRDITTLKLVEEELSASKALLTKFIDHAPAAVAMLDTEMRYLQVSQRWMTDYKIIGQDIIGKSHYEVFPDLPQASKEIHQRCLAGAIITDHEDTFQQNDGTTEWLQSETRPWHKPGGEIGGIFLYTQIITARKQSEELIRQSEEKYRNILETVEEGYFETDLRGHFAFFNDSLCQLLGYEREDLMGVTSKLFTDEKNYRKIFDIFNEVYKTNQSSHIPNWEVIRKGGERRVHESSVSLIRNAGNEPIGFRGVVRDITERKRAELESRVVTEIIQGVTLTSNLEEFLAMVHLSVSKVIYAENFYVALYDKQTELINIPFCRDKFDAVALPQRLGKGLTAYTFRHGRPALLKENDIHELVRAGEIELIGTPPAVWLGVPLRTPAGVIGVLVVQHYENETVFTKRDIELLSSAGDQIAMAIERKRSEDELKESQEWLAAMFEASQDGIVVEENGLIVFANKRYSRMCGFELEELIGTHVSKLLTPEDSERMTEYGRMRERGEEVPTLYEFTRLDRNGDQTAVEASISTFTSKGKFYIVTAQKDITERKRAEEKLRKSEKEQRVLAERLETERTRLERAQSVAKVGSWEADLLLGTFTWSAETYRIFEVEPDSFVKSQREFLRIVHPEDRKLVYESIKNSQGETAAKPLDHRVLLPDGRIKVARERWQVLCDESGTPARLLGTTQDITSQKQDEEKLRASEIRLSEAQHMAGLGSWEWDVTLGSVVWSDEFYRIFGFEPKEIEPTFERYLSFVHPDDLGLVKEMGNKAMRGDCEYDYFHRFIRTDGEVRVARSKGLVTLGGDGRIAKITGTIQDITVQKELENELKHTRDAALETARLKSEFLANMSHEIRTPMNGVVGMTGLLLDTELSSRQQEYAETIQSSADSLLTIIDDILDFSKIESGLLRFETIDFDLRSAVESPLALLAEKAQAKGLEVASLVYQDVPTALRGDPGRLRQILTNLIGNAIKFTDEGEVVVSVKKETEGENQVVLRFEIKDTGIGISPEAQKRLFQAFTQADGSTTRKYGGTGLGLAISKQLVELMDGSIGIESLPGEGSTFWFTGKFEKQAESAHIIEQSFSSNLNDYRVLIVDDNATNRKIMVHQCQSWSMIAAEAESGQQALELLHEASASGQPFNVALLDLMMPEMDGFQLADAIKADPAIAGVSLVLLPSFGQRGHGEAAQNAGIAAYLQKPVRQSQLFDCLAAVTSGSAPSETVRKLVTQHTLEENRVKREKSSAILNARILVAEDNPVNQKVALGQLENLGYEAQAVMNGIEVIKAVETGDFDIIFMDCQMPVMDGFEATAEIRRREGNSRRTIIVAMTANALEGDREKCIAAGMDDYLSKPVKFAVLSEMLGRWLMVTPSRTPTIEKNGHSRAVDLSVIGSLREMQQEGKPDFVTEIIDLFLEDAALQLNQLRAALAANDSEERKRLAHLIKGSSANVGAEEMARLLDDIEHREINVADGRTAYEKLENEFKRVKADLLTERQVPSE